MPRPDAKAEADFLATLNQPARSLSCCITGHVGEVSGGGRAECVCLDTVDVTKIVGQPDDILVRHPTFLTLCQTAREWIFLMGLTCTMVIPPFTSSLSAQHQGRRVRPYRRQELRPRGCMGAAESWCHLAGAWHENSILYCITPVPTILMPLYPQSDSTPMGRSSGADGTTIDDAWPYG